MVGARGFGFQPGTSAGGRTLPKAQSDRRGTYPLGAITSLAVEQAWFGRGERI